MFYRCRQFSQRFTRGFTLLELVLVMLLITITLAIAVPAMSGFLSGSKVRDTATQMIAVAQYAKARSAAEAKVYRFNLSGDSYWLTVEEGQAFRPVGTDLGKRLTIASDLLIELVPLDRRGGGGGGAMDASGISFFPDGRTSPALLRLSDPQGRVKLIGCPSPAESFRVLTEAEAGRLSTDRVTEVSR
jgi:prepilin-type N-terminal cleavage/methylation domain-containing protein